MWRNISRRNRSVVFIAFFIAGYDALRKLSHVFNIYLSFFYNVSLHLDTWIKERVSNFVLNCYFLFALINLKTEESYTKFYERHVKLSEWFNILHLITHQATILMEPLEKPS